MTYVTLDIFEKFLRVTGITNGYEYKELYRRKLIPTKLLPRIPHKYYKAPPGSGVTRGTYVPRGTYSKMFEKKYGMKFNKKFLIILIGSIIVYSLFLILSDFSKLSEEILDFEIMYLPLILILVPLGWLALYFRWTFLVKNSGYVLPHKKNFQIFLSGFPLSITPGKVGELLKCELLKENFNIPRKITAPIILVERLYNGVGIVIISSLGIWYFDFSGTVILIASCALIGIFIALRSKSLFSSLINKTSKIKYLSKFSDSFSDSYEVINHSIKPKIFIISSLLSAIYWIL